MRSSHASILSLLTAAGLALCFGLAGVASAAEDEEQAPSVLLSDEEETTDPTDEEDASEALDEGEPELIGGPTRPILTGEPIEDLYVTATKRSESIQDVAISMKALDADFLKDSGLTEFGQLQEYVPNLSINPVTDTRGTVIRIRGIGSAGNNSGIDPSVGVFIDGVYQGRAGMSVGDMLDVERVEVLRGPQGTLYGKNTAAGLISIVSKNPHYDGIETSLEGVIGSEDDFQGRGSVNVPIVDGKMATRLSGYRVTRDGFDKNIFDGGEVNDADKWGVKSRTLFDVSDSLSLTLTADYSREDTECCVPDVSRYDGFPTLLPSLHFQALAAGTGIPLPNADGFDRDVAVDVKPENEVEIGGVSLVAEYEFGESPLLADWIEGNTLTAIGAWRTYSSDSQFDGDFSWYNGILAFTNTDLDQYSLELRLASPGAEFFDYQTGLYFYHQSQDTLDRNGFEQDIIDAAGGFFLSDPFSNIGTNTHKTTSVAGFGQMTLNFSEQLSLTGGLRYTYEKKERDGTQVSTSALPIDAPPLLGPPIDVSQDRTAQNVSGTAILRFFPTDNAMAYLSWASGFKSGGFNQLRTQAGVPGVMNMS